MSTLTLPRILNGRPAKTGSEDHVFAVIYETYDYQKFKFLGTNRDLIRSNYKALLTSFMEAYLLALVIVNEKYEIIDGQHRFRAAEELELPVRYAVMPGYGIKEVRQYNKVMQKWVRSTYLKSFTTEGKDEYVELTEFMKQFPKFGIHVSMKLLTGVSREQKRENGERVCSKSFEEGGLILKNRAKAYVIARKIMDFEDYFPSFNSPKFVASLYPILNLKHYDHKRMLQKLKSSPYRLEKQGTHDQYRLLLQKIYNYKTTPENRVDFFNV
jgi:hypothetical protein